MHKPSVIHRLKSLFKPFEYPVGDTAFHIAKHAVKFGGVHQKNTLLEKGQNQVVHISGKNQTRFKRSLENQGWKTMKTTQNLVHPFGHAFIRFTPDKIHIWGHKG